MKYRGPIFFLLALCLAACDAGDLPQDLSGPAATGAKASPATPARAHRKEVLIELERWKDPSELVLVGKGGVLSGPADGPLARSVFSSRERDEDLRFFVRTYAPFRTAVPGGELVFHGKGRQRPGPVERRMIAEWTRLVAAEVAGGRAGSSYGLVLSWHRSGGTGICDDVTVYLTGEARAASCSWEHEARGRLEPATLARVYEWFDELAPFQSGGGEEDLAGGTQSSLIFAGKGKREATPAETAQMTALPAALFRELSGRAPGPAVPPAGMASAPAPATGETPAGLSPGTRLLLPSRSVTRTGPRPGTEVVLQLPEEPPPIVVPEPAAPPGTAPRPRPAPPPRAPAPSAPRRQAPETVPQSPP